MANKCILIDDEQYAIDALATYIEKIPDLVVVATYTDPLLALNEIQKQAKFDFIFLDIEMPGISGLELAKKLRQHCRSLIFTTGHPSYAVEAFDVKADRYLLKPITLSKFAFTINDLLNEAEVKPTVATREQKKLQFVRADQKHSYYVIDEADITAIVADKNHVYIYTLSATEPYHAHLSLSYVEKALGTEAFIKINKSTIIAKNQIRKVDGNLVSLKDGKSHVLGAIFKKDFQTFMQANLLQN